MAEGKEEVALLSLELCQGTAEGFLLVIALGIKRGGGDVNAGWKKTPHHV